MVSVIHTYPYTVTESSPDPYDSSVRPLRLQPLFVFLTLGPKVGRGTSGSLPYVSPSPPCGPLYEGCGPSLPWEYDDVLLSRTSWKWVP